MLTEKNHFIYSLTLCSPSNTLVGPLLLAPEHNMDEGNILPALEENAELLKHSACYEVGAQTYLVKITKRLKKTHLISEVFVIANVQSS